MSCRSYEESPSSGDSEKVLSSPDDDEEYMPCKSTRGPSRGPKKSDGKKAAQPPQPRKCPFQVSSGTMPTLMCLFMIGNSWLPTVVLLQYALMFSRTGNYLTDVWMVKQEQSGTVLHAQFTTDYMVMSIQSMMLAGGISGCAQPRQN